MWADISCSSATRTAALSFNRVERRTSLTSSSSFVLIASSSPANVSASFGFSSPTAPRSTALSFLPLYSPIVLTTYSSTGSVSSSTSCPLATNASTYGDRSICRRVSPIR